MTERERVVAAVRHEEVDRIPVDLGATPSSGISAIAYGRLISHLRLDVGPPRVYDVVQQLAEPDDEVLDLFEIDAVDIGRAYDRAPESWHDVTLADGQSAKYPAWFRPVRHDDDSWTAVAEDGTILAKMPSGGTFFDQQCFPYLDGYPDDFAGLDEAMRRVLWAAYASAPWSHADDDDFWPELRRTAQQLRASSSRALVLGVGCNLFEWGTFLRRMDRFLMDLILDPTGVEALLDALIERHMATLAKVCEYVGDLVDIVKFGDDLGTDQGPFMAPGLYRRYFKPHHRRLCEYTKRHSTMHTCLHSCGSIADLLPDLIEAGFEIINPVQTNARNMEPERLKHDFGDSVCFWGGGIDTRSVLNRGTPGEVREAVLRNLDVFSRGGGYVFNTVHNILPDVPPQNITAMFDALREFNGLSPLRC